MFQKQKYFVFNTFLFKNKIIQIFDKIRMRTPLDWTVNVVNLRKFIALNDIKFFEMFSYFLISFKLNLNKIVYKKKLN
jgi:hypothetical protein